MADEDFDEMDDFEKFAREMKARPMACQGLRGFGFQEIREMSDHGARKDRACDLALRLAASLGVDSESD